MEEEFQFVSDLIEQESSKILTESDIWTSDFKGRAIQIED